MTLIGEVGWGREVAMLGAAFAKAVVAHAFATLAAKAVSSKTQND